MTEDNWTDRIAAERMRVDQQFESRIEGSSFNRQQWGLVMTAVEFEIENPQDPETARMVADTSKLSSVMAQVEEIGNRGPAMGGGGGSSGSTTSSGGGLLGKLSDALGLGGDDSGENPLRGEAETLAGEYAEQLQAQLEERGRWDGICEQAAAG